MHFRVILSALSVALFVTLPTSPAQAGCQTHVDAYGNTSFGCGADMNSGHTRTNRFGNTTGRIGGQRLNRYTDPYGNTTGRLGGQRFRSRTDPYGNTTGRIGNRRFRCRTDALGNARCR